MAFVVVLSCQFADAAQAAKWIATGYVAIIILITAIDMVRDILRGHFGLDILALVAMIAAISVGEYLAAMIIVLMLSGGEALEDYAAQRAQKDLNALLDRAPHTAHRLRSDASDATVDDIDISEVAAGDLLLIKPAEVVPVDCELLSDEAEFDESSLTGESLPVTRTRGDAVYSGSVNGERVIRVRATADAASSQYQQIIALVKAADESKAPTVRVADRFAVPFTLVSLATAGLAWWLSGDPVRFAEVLVLATPCPLLIAAPVAFMGGMSASARNGVIVKGGATIEALSRAKSAAFDKTGTLTTGEFAVQSVEGLDEEALKTVSAIEKSSNHPIAKAIVRYCPTDEKIDAKDIAGHGLQTDEWLVGNLKLLERENVFFPDALRNIPETVVCVAHLGRYVGHIILADKVKDDAKQAVESLPVRVEMLSGDRQELVSKVASSLGIRKAYGDLLPEGKVKHIEQAKHMGQRVAFVGDGINDAPVLALSDVGIAMGGLGSDMAIETADIIIQTDQPSKVADAIRIGKYTRRIVNQNIWLALIIKALVMLLGLLGLANLWMAVFADSGVALLAVLNSSRIFLKNNK